MHLPKTHEAYVVHKFGGTSVGSASAIRQVVDIINSCKSSRIAVVVSGMGGKPKVTDLLLNAMTFAKKNQEERYLELIDQLTRKHHEAVFELLPNDLAQEIMQHIEKDLKRIKEILRAVSIMQSYNQRVMELVSGHGELWSARILTAVLNQKKNETFVMVDAREILIVEEHDDQGPSILWEESTARLEKFVTPDTTRLVITGFIASTKDGVPTTLKRDGSDYSASIFARLLKASKISIWTDVNGVLSADPRRVPESKSLPRISYEEAMELAYFGAKVIHPKTMVPAILASIPIYIRNTFEPQHPGTCIFLKNTTSDRIRQDARIVSGFSAVDNLALFNLEGSGMIGVLGVASRLFGALEKEKVNVVLIAQASSEHSICFAVPIERAETTKAALEATFYREIHVGHIQTIEFIAPISIVAAVGDNMSHTPGVCARFFGAFRRAKINVLAISQGSSERNISAVVHSKDSASALRSAHTAFFLSEQTISVGIVCSGDLLSSTTNVSAAQALFEQLKRQHAWLKSRYRVDIRIRAICDSRRTFQHPVGIDLDHWEDELKKTGAIREGNMSDVLSAATHIKADHMPNWLLIDLTHDESLVTFYPTWLQEGVHIISGNVFAASCSMDQYHKLVQFRCRNNTSLKLEPCIGAGLPVLHMLQNLLQTGDPIQHIDAELSGTMEYVLSAMNKDSSKRFSDVAREAMQLGLTGNNGFSVSLEDFTGVTSSRKLVAIARELGIDLNVEDIDVENVIVDPCPMDETRSLTGEELIKHLETFNDAMAQQVQEAKREKRVLSLMSRVDANGKASVKLAQIPTSHPFASLEGPTNAVCFYTERYKEHPLSVHGPAAGPSILASSVFGSLLSLTRELGASDHGSEDEHELTSPRKFVLRMSPSQSANDLSSLN